MKRTKFEKRMWRAFKKHPERFVRIPGTSIWIAPSQ